MKTPQLLNYAADQWIAGEVIKLVQLLLAGHDREAERLHHPRSVVKGQLAQRRSADFAGVVQHSAEIDPVRAGHCDRRAVDRARDLRKVAVTSDPAVAFVIKELESLHARPLEEVQAKQERANDSAGTANCA